MIIGQLISLMDKPKFKNLLLFSIACCLAGVYEIRALYLSSIVSILFVVARLISSGSLKYIIVRTVYLIPSALIISAFNLYWIMALSGLDYLSSNNPLFNRTLFGSYFMSVNKSLTLFHPFWSGGRLEPFVIQTISLYFYLIPALALLPFTKRGIHRSYYVFFAIVTCMGIFLTKMSNPPFGDVYGWFYLNFPGFNAFRESSKFYFYIALGYSVLIAINFNSFSQWV